MTFGGPPYGPTGTPGGNAFDGGAELFVGEISTIRTFDLQADGTLWGLMHFGRPWRAGPNTAVCEQHARAGARGCRCGFWSYGHISGISAQTASRTVTAVIDNWGRITPGTRGIRAEHAAIRALYLAPHVSDRLVAKVADRYAGVGIFRDQDEMLAAHPLTELGVFDTTPVAPPPGAGRRGMAVGAFVAVGVLLLLGLLLGGQGGEGSSWQAFVVPAVFFGLYALGRTARIVATGPRSEDGDPLSPARSVTQVNATLVAVLLLVSYLLPGAPATTVVLFLLFTVGRQLLRRHVAGSVPIRRTPGALVLRAVSKRHRRALRA